MSASKQRTKRATFAFSCPDRGGDGEIGARLGFNPGVDGIKRTELKHNLCALDRARAEDLSSLQDASSNDHCGGGLRGGNPIDALTEAALEGSHLGAGRGVMYGKGRVVTN